MGRCLEALVVARWHLAMPKFSENCHVFYRRYDGTVHDVSFAEVAKFMTQEAIAAMYGGDGTCLSSAQAFYDSLDRLGEENFPGSKVKDKRMVYFWAEKKGVKDVHETLAHSAEEGWETLPCQAANGYYSCKNPDMPSAPRWPAAGEGWCQEENKHSTSIEATRRKAAGRLPSVIW